MARSSGLGKGLSSIIPTAERPDGDDAASAAVLADIAVAAITPNPHQPRVHFDEESLSELTASIAEMGVLQPILIRPLGEHTYELIAGERRWRAAQRAGLTTIPAVIRVTDDASSVEQALVENLHRQDLTALEEAAAYQQLIDDFGLTHDQVSTRVGKSRSAITNSLPLAGPPAGGAASARRWAVVGRTRTCAARNSRSLTPGVTGPRGGGWWVVGPYGRRRRPTRRRTGGSRTDRTAEHHRSMAPG